MTKEEISQLLDSAEADLSFVSLSLLGADPAMLEEAETVLQRLVESVYRAKAAIPSSGSLWPPAVRLRLQNLHGNIRRLRTLSNAAMSTVLLRGRRPGLLSGEYSPAGRPLAPAHIGTIALDY